MDIVNNSCKLVEYLFMLNYLHEFIWVLVPPLGLRVNIFFFFFLRHISIQRYCIKYLNGESTALVSVLKLSLFCYEWYSTTLAQLIYIRALVLFFDGQGMSLISLFLLDELCRYFDACRFCGIIVLPHVWDIW